MKRSFALLLLVSCVWLMSSRGTASSVLIVHLKPSVLVVDPIITIGDIAVLADGTQKLHEAVAGLDLVELGTTEATMISREQIAIRMQLAGHDPRSFRISGVERVQVMLDRSQVTQESIVAAARQAIRRKMPTKGERSSFRLLRPVTVPQLVIKPGDHIYLAADWPGSAKDEGPVEIDVAVTINGKRQATVPVLLSLGITAAEESPVKAEPRNKPLKAAPASMPRTPNASENLPSGFLVSRDRGTAPVENPIVVRYRDGVKLIAQVGNLRVSVSGEALQEGRVGQTIRVRNIDSQKTVLGRVVGAGLVEIDF